MLEFEPARQDDDLEDPALKGYKPGDTPSLTWTPTYWLVRPSATQETDNQVQVAGEIRRLCQERAITLSSTRAVREHARGEAAVEVLRMSDVERLYKLAHKRLLVVLMTTGAVRVTRIAGDVGTMKGSVPLGQYLAHKASVTLITHVNEVQARLDEAQAWVTQPPGIDDRHDPRCLPMLCFARCEHLPLDTTEQRRAFRNHFGRTPIDRYGTEWKTEEFHALDPQHIAGATLPLGSHWNAQASKVNTVANGWEVWDLPRGAYLNVHPNGHLRGGSSDATKVFPTSRKPSVARAAKSRTPRHRRSGR